MSLGILWGYSGGNGDARWASVIGLTEVTFGGGGSGESTTLLEGTSGTGGRCGSIMDWWRGFGRSGSMGNAEKVAHSRPWSGFAQNSLASIE